MPEILPLEHDVFHKKVFVLAGHGAWDYKTKRFATVPLNTTVTIWRHPPGTMTNAQGGGNAAGLLDDRLGQRIDKCKFEKAYVEVSGTVAARTLPLTYQAGESIHDFILFPAGKNTLGRLAGDDMFTPHNAVHFLSHLLLQHSGSNIHWSACVEQNERRAQYFNFRSDGPASKSNTVAGESVVAQLDAGGGVWRLKD